MDGKIRLTILPRRSQPKFKIKLTRDNQTIRKLNVSGNGIINYDQIFNRSSARAEKIFYFRHSEKILIFFPKIFGNFLRFFEFL